MGGETTVVRFELSLKSLFIVLAVSAGVWMLLNLLPVLLVLVTALMLVGALNPLVTWLEQRKVGRITAICIVFGIGLAAAITFAILTVPTVIAQARNVVEHEPEIREKIAGYLDRSPLTDTLADNLRDVSYADLLKSSQTSLLTLSTRLFEILAYGVAAIFLAFYIQIDRDRLRGALFAVVPRSHHIRLSRILLNLGTIVGGYIRGQVLTCVLMGGFILVLLLACRVPNALAIAVFGSAMDLLPYIGIFLTMAPAVLAAAMKGPVVATIVFALMLAYEELESRVLVPLVYGRALRLPSSVVFFSLIMGTALAGIVGALLALPIAAAVLMLVEELRVELPGETIQPEDLAQRREDDRGELEYERRTESMTAEKSAAIAVEISGDRKKDEGEAEKVQAGSNPGHTKGAAAPP
jgi:predicted PurR-regulated permease PerM